MIQLELPLADDPKGMPPMYENFGQGWRPCKPPAGTGSFMKKRRYFNDDEDPLEDLKLSGEPRLEGVGRTKEKKRKKKRGVITPHAASAAQVESSLSGVSAQDQASAQAPEPPAKEPGGQGDGQC